MDARYRQASSGTRNSTYLNSVELDLQHPITIDNQQQGNVYAQVIAENTLDIRPTGAESDVRLGEAYATYRLPIMT